MSNRGTLTRIFIVNIITITLLMITPILPALAEASQATTTGSLSLIPTFECLSVYSNFSGDTDGDNQAILEYRASGGTWQQGIPLTPDRRETIAHTNPIPNPYKDQWRGSIIGLSPNTLYEVRVTYTDPDGVNGTNPVTATIRTRNEDVPTGTGSTYYVATNGNDANSGTISQPFQTIQKAADIVMPGDIVYVRQGTYYEQIELRRSGNANNYIHFCPYTGEEVTIDFQNANFGISFIGANYIKLNGFNLTNAAWIAVCLVNESSYNFIENNTITDFGYSNPDAGIGITGGSSHNVLQYNYIESLRAAGPNSNHREDGISFYRGREPGDGGGAGRVPTTQTVIGPGNGTIVRYNTIISDIDSYAISDGIGGDTNTDIQDGPFKDADIYGNVIDGMSDDTIEIEGGNINVRVWNNTLGHGRFSTIGFAPVVVGPLYIYRNSLNVYKYGFKVGWSRNYDGYAYVYHNTMYTTVDWGTTSVQNSGGDRFDNFIFKNNIFREHSRTYALRTSGPDVSDSGYYCVFDYNNPWIEWVDTGRSFGGWNGTDYYDLPEFQAGTGFELNGVFEDSLFVDEPSGNIQLQADSPNIDKGEVLIGFNDANSQWPYNGTAPDIGVFEYGSGGATNRPPVLNTIGNKSTNEEQLLQFTVSATDPDGDPLDYSASNLPTGADFDTDTHTFSWTPTSGQAGTYPDIHFEVSDGDLTDSEDITITVNPVGTNNPPVLNTIGNKSTNEEQLLQFTVSATDPDGDPLDYSASNLPTGADFDTDTHTFSWTPTSGQAGTYPDIHFEVSDGDLTDSEDITITVNSPGQPPSLPLGVNAGGNAYTDSSGNNWSADQAYSSGSWGFYGSDNTVDRGTDLAISNTEDDRIYQTERYGLSGYLFDLGNGTYDISLHFAETYHSSPGDRIFDVYFEGQLALDNLDICSEVGSNAALIKTFSNIPVTDGQLNIDFTASVDNPEINGIVIFNAGTAPNNPPVLNPIGNKSVDEGELLEFVISATDPDGDPLDYSASNLPTGADFDTDTHIFSWTPTSGQAGTYPDIHFVVSDGDLIDSEDIEINVDEPSPFVGGGGGGGGGGPDTSPPRFSDVTVSDISKTSATISWATHEKSDSQVEYWASPHQLSPLDETLVRSHVVQLTDLNPATTYYYNVESRDAAGNLAVSGGHTFTTLGTPATFVVSNMDINPTEVNTGEAVIISITVTNNGDAAGDYEVVLKIDDTVLATKEVTGLPGGATQEVVFNAARDVADSYTVEVNGTTGSFTVTEAPVTEAILFQVDPTYNAETGLFARARITYEVESPAEPMADVRLVLKVGLDGEPIEEIPLFTANQLEMGRSGSLDYIPPRGWENGTYTFQAKLYADGGLYTSTAVAEMEVSADTAVAVVRWATLGAIIGIMLIVIVATVVMILRRRRDMLGA